MYSTKNRHRFTETATSAATATHWAKQGTSQRYRT